MKVNISLRSSLLRCLSKYYIRITPLFMNYVLCKTHLAFFTLLHEHHLIYKCQECNWKILDPIIIFYYITALVKRLKNKRYESILFSLLFHIYILYLRTSSFVILSSKTALNKFQNYVKKRHPIYRNRCLKFVCRRPTILYKFSKFFI